jgi:hypothetical protein
MKRCDQCSQRPGKYYYKVSYTQNQASILRITLCPKCYKSREFDLWHFLLRTREDAKIYQVTQAMQHSAMHE